MAADHSSIAGDQRPAGERTRMNAETGHQAASANPDPGTADRAPQIDWSTYAPVGDELRKVAERLNAEQQLSMITTEGSVCMVAGAGTGKTSALTARLAFLMEARSVQPGKILSVTFTNKAAGEMRERVERMVGPKVHQAALGSFHSVSMLMLRNHAMAVGLKSPSFKILDAPEQREILEIAIENLERAGHPAVRELPAGKGRKDELKKLYTWLQDLKEEGRTVEDAAALHGDDASIVVFYRAYQAALLERNACDFADLLLYMVHLFRTDPVVKQRWSEQFDYVMVDEFQDTNDLQYEWICHLAKRHGNICVVGDPDQSIYEWRKARPEIMDMFPQEWPGCRTIVLFRNYRSTQTILDPANMLVDHNPRSIPKELKGRPGGKPVCCYLYQSSDQEAESVANEINRLIQGGERPREIAVLLRTGFLMFPFERAFKRAGIDYQVVGAQAFYEREEVKDCIAYMRLALDPRDDIALSRILNKPRRALAGAALAGIREAMEQLGPQATLAEAARHTADYRPRLQKKAREALRDLAELLDDLRIAGGREITPWSILNEAVERSGYRRWRADDENDEAADQRIENIERLLEDVRDYSTVDEFLSTVALASASDKGGRDEAIHLSTIHASKGLEYNVVFTPALEDGVVPNTRALKTDYGLFEERRIIHVAWTRARHLLFVSAAEFRAGGSSGMPSDFLREAELTLERDPKAAADSYGRYGGAAGSGGGRTPYWMRRAFGR